MKARIGLSLLLGCALGLVAGPVHADGVRRDGIGAVSIGRGGTNIAMSDNGAILFDNPAGMANLTSQGLFEFGGDLLFTDLHYSNPLNFNRSNRHDAMGLPFLSYMRRTDDGRFAYGVGVFAPAGFGAEWHLNNPLFGEQRYESFGALATFLPGIAYRVTDRLSIGGTFGVAISHAQLNGPFVGQTGVLQGIPTLLNLHATGATPTWSVGLQYDVSDRTRLGLTYIEETRFNMDGNAQVTVPVPGLPPLNSRFDADVHLTWPRSLGGGISHLFGEARNHRASVDVIWINWSQAFRDVGLNLSDSSNPILPALLGPSIGDRFPLSWRDSVSVRLGYEYFLQPTQVVRFGYIYHPQPIPNQTLSPYIPAILQHAFSIGYGKQWDRWAVNVAYQYSLGENQEVQQSSFLGGDFDRSRIGAQVHWLALSLQYRF
jgi:long-chain fatty acid transport protein